MHPVFRELFTKKSFTLSDLILVMWKNQIFRSHMNIDLSTKMTHITSRTFDMPSWTTTNDLLLTIDDKYSIPIIITIFRSIVSLPESKIRRLVFFVLVIIYPHA
jgi:hypothetical protein